LNPVLISTTGIRMLLKPVTPGRYGHRGPIQLDPRMSKLSNHRLACHRVPKRVCCAVVHQFVVLVQKPRRPKSDVLSIPFGVVHDSQIAKCSEHKRYLLAAKTIVCQLMPAHDSMWLGARFSVNRHSKNRFIQIQIIDLVARHHIRELQRRNSITNDAAPLH
jgi:hypothetical protein